MKTNKEAMKSAMDRRLSFLDELPSCRASVQQRIAQEETPVMKKKISLGVVFAIVLVCLSAIGVATGFLLSPKADAARIADAALEEKYGVNYLYSDFKKKEGYKRSNELSRRYNLYRQHYCGCEFSLEV